MPPKRGKKRRQDSDASADGKDDDVDLSPPNREEWPGWVEMESEPALFNVMLKEMGVIGVKVQEVYGIDDEMLAILPQPVHALIFLFRYRETDWPETDLGTGCPKHVWFANQTPDFACATFALLNIINNIPGLHLGQRLDDFKTYTKDMDALSRGDAVDDFTFVKKIHNSFASENDLLQADMFLKMKADKLKKRQAVEKAMQTKAAKKAAPKVEKCLADATPTRVSTRARRPARRTTDDCSDDGHDDYKANIRDRLSPSRDTPRRSTRAPKPRRDPYSHADTDGVSTGEEGFHFIAYMPIADHVWKLDGLDRVPRDMGPFDTKAQNWMSIVQPALLGRMAQYEGAEIEFNLMAVVHDPLEADRTAISQNVVALQSIEKELDDACGDWRTAHSADEVIDATFLARLGLSSPDNLTNTDPPVPPISMSSDSQDAADEGNISTEIVVKAATQPDSRPACTPNNGAETDEDEIVVSLKPRWQNRSPPDPNPRPIAESSHDPHAIPNTILTQAAATTADPSKIQTLLRARQDLQTRHQLLRGSLRNGLEAEEQDAEKARHRRHDYGKFVREWLLALANEELLSDLLRD